MPLDIPEHIEIDVTNLNIGDSILLGTVKIEKVEVLGDPEQPIVNVMPPTVVKEPVAEVAEVAEEEAAEEAEKTTAE